MPPYTPNQLPEPQDQPPYQPQMPPQQPQFPQPQPTGGSIQPLAIVALVLSFFFSLPGLIISIIALKKYKTGPSHAMALAGLIISILMLLITIPVAILLMVNMFRGVQQLSQIQANATHYSLVTRTDSFTAASYNGLIAASSGFFATLTDTNGSPAPQYAKATVSLGKDNFSLLTYDAQGNYAANGRFGLFNVPNTTLMCLTDYTNSVSLMIEFDPAGGDGNTAQIVVYDETNCRPSDPSITDYQHGDITITNTITVNSAAQVPDSSKAVFAGIVQELQSSGGKRMVQGIQAHFIDSFDGAFGNTTQ